MKSWIASSWVLLTVSLGTALFPGSCSADEGKANKPFEVEIKRDLTYYEGEDADKVKHKLDLYLPRGVKDFPVVFFVHGGAWISGDKDYFGVYTALGKMFARHGIGAVVINYRLSPKVMHPEHIKDVARAFAWTHTNIQKYGGRPDQIILCGHSAGGHLVSLLATDESYLKAEGLGLKDIKAVVPISGVYVIPDKLFAAVFGKDPEGLKNASPITHVAAGEPPFLVIYADMDFPTCDKMSEDFCKALKEKNVAVETLQIKKRNHISILTNTVLDDDPCAEAILKFVAAQTKP